MRRRIFYSDNATLTDLSVNLQNYHSGTNSFTFVASEDAFYIGSYLPFNHLYFKMNGSNVNANASVLTISYWDGQWRDAVEVIDETSSAGKSLAQSGFIIWVPDKSYGWTREDTNYSSGSVTGLTSVKIYDLYWVEMTFSADLTAGTALAWVGQKFSDDNDLGSEYSDLVRSAMMTAYEDGKTTWEEQHIRAADVLINDIISKGFISFGEQILERDDFRLPAVSKCAEIIYGGLGDDYKDEKKEAKAEYQERLGKLLPKIDGNANARFDINEKITQGSLVR